MPDGTRERRSGHQRSQWGLQLKSKERSGSTNLSVVPLSSFRCGVNDNRRPVSAPQLLSRNGLPLRMTALRAICRMMAREVSLKNAVPVSSFHFPFSPPWVSGAGSDSCSGWARCDRKLGVEPRATAGGFRGAFRWSGKHLDLAAVGPEHNISAAVRFKPSCVV